jgi:hypothetical protein
VPQSPPRDANGAVVPHDHSEILPEHFVIRRISEKQIVTDRAGQRRISSIAFKPSSGVNGGMSVDLEHCISAKGLDPREFVTTPIWTGSVYFRVDKLRGAALQVGYDPIPDNDCHGEVWGMTTRAQYKWLQEQAAWYVEIVGVQLGAV